MSLTLLGNKHGCNSWPETTGVPRQLRGARSCGGAVRVAPSPFASSLCRRSEDVTRLSP